MADWKSRAAIGVTAVGCLILAAVAFVGLGILGLLWFGIRQLF